MYEYESDASKPKLELRVRSGLYNVHFVLDFVLAPKRNAMEANARTSTNSPRKVSEARERSESSMENIEPNKREREREKERKRKVG